MRLRFMEIMGGQIERWDFYSKFNGKTQGY